MKIACVTDDGQTISQHFGRATHYVVVTVEDGLVVSRELRPKGAHPRATAGVEHVPGQLRGLGEGSHNAHVTMAEVISDCDVLLCRGMGYGAYQSMQQVGITPMVTDVADIEEAVQTYIDGQLVDHTELLH
jgi:predicted Fe-Mo cluster-binding NifX family protein